MSEFLFDENLLRDIDKSVFKSVSDDTGIKFPEVGAKLILRPMSTNDYDKGFLDVLAQLTSVGNISRELFLNRFRSMLECRNSYYIVVIEDTSKNLVVACATLVIEQKFIHSCSQRGRIEDVVVSQDYQKRNLGKILLSTLCSLSEKLRCYKLTLECKDHLVPFYKSFGFERESNNSNYLQKRFENL